MHEEQEYITLAEAAEQIGIKRASIYYYLKRLDIKTHQFNFNKHTFIATVDLKRIKELKEKPWIAGPKNIDKEVA